MIKMMEIDEIDEIDENDENDENDRNDKSYLKEVLASFFLFTSVSSIFSGTIQINPNQIFFQELDKFFKNLKLQLPTKICGLCINPSLGHFL